MMFGNPVDIVVAFALLTAEKVLRTLFTSGTFDTS